MNRQFLRRKVVTTCWVFIVTGMLFVFTLYRWPWLLFPVLKPHDLSADPIYKAFLAEVQGRGCEIPNFPQYLWIRGKDEAAAHLDVQFDNHSSKLWFFLKPHNSREEGTVAAVKSNTFFVTARVGDVDFTVGSDNTEDILAFASAFPCLLDPSAADDALRKVSPEEHVP